MTPFGGGWLASHGLSEGQLAHEFALQSLRDSGGAKRVARADAIVVLAVIEVLGEQFDACGPLGRSENHRVPVAKLVLPMVADGGMNERQIDFHNLQADERANRPLRLMGVENPLRVTVA